MRRSFVFVLLLLLTSTTFGQGVKLTLPMRDGSLRFAVLGDTGTGSSSQVKVAQQLTKHRQLFPFEFVILLGDNLYGGENPSDFVRKFERPYKPLLDAGVKFYASLGNHDEPAQKFYKPFNMNGENYYTFRPKLGVRFFALDSNYLDPAQVQWLEKELAASGSDWKIAFFHHPPYSSGRHGSNLEIRQLLEPIFTKHGVTVVFTGHEHFYERIKPQKGVAYFVAGSSAKLRRGDIDPSNLTAKGYDQGLTFMLVEVAGDEMHFQTIGEKGETVDSGMIRRVELPSGRPAVTATSGTTPVTPAR